MKVNEAGERVELVLSACEHDITREAAAQRLGRAVTAEEGSASWLEPEDFNTLFNYYNLTSEPVRNGKSPRLSLSERQARLFGECLSAVSIQESATLLVSGSLETAEVESSLLAGDDAGRISDKLAEMAEAKVDMSDLDALPVTDDPEASRIDTSDLDQGVPEEWVSQYGG
jgi:hypothetical protein